jgi:hypothetical protein
MRCILRLPRRASGLLLVAALSWSATLPLPGGAQQASAPAELPPQEPTEPMAVAPLATLAIWADDVWLTIVDRDGSYFGRLAEEGILQRFNPLMDEEYDLDIATGLFTATEDARWAGTDAGLRLAGASIDHPRILNDIDLRQPVEIAGSVDLLFRYRRQRSLTAQRDYPRLGLRWREMGGSEWNGRVAMGIHFFKPSADLEVGVDREWRTSERSAITADLRVALLDVFNNAIFKGLGVDPELVDAHLEYTTVPLATRLVIEWSLPMARFEVEGGLTTRSHLAVTFPATGDPSYSQAEQVGFVGGLAEVAISRRVALAAYGTWARAETDRAFTDPGDDDFEIREETWSVGARAGAALSRNLIVEADLGGLWRPEDRTTGDGSMVRHRDETLFGAIALVHRPSVGWLWRISVPFTDRDAGETLPELTATNSRLVLEGGHRWASSFYFMAGVRWDLDNFGQRAFDGGHVRLQATW